MPIDRDVFAEVLEYLQPATKSGKDDPPIFGCACFDGAFVHSFDDVLAVRMAFPFPVPGGYNASLLGRWTKSVKNKEIEVERKGNSVLFRSGRSRIEMSPMPEDAFVFELPAEKNETALEIDLEEIIKASEAVTPCAQREDAGTWKYGITIHLDPKHKRVDVYSMNVMAAAYATIPYAGGAEGDYQVPAQFFELVAKHKASIKGIVATKQSIIADFEGVRIYSRLNANKNVENYRKNLPSTLVKDIREKLLPLPKGFGQALDRVLMVMKEEEKLNITAVDDKLILAAESKDGSARANEKLKLPDHASASVAVAKAREFLKPLVPKAKSIAILPRTCLALEAEGVLYMMRLVERDDGADQKED